MTDQETIAKLRSEWVTAFNSADIDAIDGMFAQDAVSMPPNEVQTPPAKTWPPTLPRWVLESR